MSQTIEIPRENWSRFLDEISRRATDRPVRVETLDRELGDQQVTGRIALVGIAYETRGSDAGSIDVTVANADARSELDHRIAQPVGIWARLGDEGRLDCLEIEEQGGAKTLVYFEERIELPPHAAAEAPPLE